MSFPADPELALEPPPSLSLMGQQRLSVPSVHPSAQTARRPPGPFRDFFAASFPPESQTATTDRATDRRCDRPPSVRVRQIADGIYAQKFITVSSNLPFKTMDAFASVICLSI